MNSNLGLMSAIAIVSATLSWGCGFPEPEKSQSNASAVTPADVTPPEAVETESSSDKIDAKQLHNLQSCTKDLEDPQLFFLTSLQKPNAPEAKTAYFVAFSRKGLKDPKDVGKVKGFTTIALAEEQCQVLTKVQAQDLATKLLHLYYKDKIAANKGKLESAWADIVNRWERDHYVSGPGDHPHVLDIGDIWVARTLNLVLPDYLPIHIHQ